MFWKIYFWIITILICFVCFVEGVGDTFFYAGPIFGTLDLLFFIVSMNGLFLYAFRKKLFSDAFWKIFLPVLVVWDLFFIIFVEPRYLTDESEILDAFIGYVLFRIPIYISIYIYAFEHADEKDPQRKRGRPKQEDAHLPEVQYPGILRRYFATLIDGFLILGIVIASSYIFQQEGEMISVVRFGIILSMLFIYEPLCTSRFCTLGQKLMRIRIRKRFLYEKISIPAAYLRIFVKLILGIISFFTIPYSKGKRAIHDFAADTIVVYEKPFIA